MKRVLISCCNIKTYWLPTKREIKIYLKTGSLIDFWGFFSPHDFYFYTKELHAAVRGVKV